MCELCKKKYLYKQHIKFLWRICWVVACLLPPFILIVYRQPTILATESRWGGRKESSLFRALLWMHTFDEGKKVLESNFFFLVLAMHRPQYLSIAHDFLVQLAQENRAHKKTKFIKTVIRDNRYIFASFQETDARSRKWLNLETVLFHIEFFSYAHDMRRPQDLPIAHDFLTQEVYAHHTRSFTSVW